MDNLKNFKATISYDGARYDGWQKQGNTDNTIQAKLEKIISVIANERIDIIASGRTDAGVHALGQVVNFHIKWDKSPKELMSLINSNLSEDIAFLSMEEVEDSFHSRFRAKEKRYIYTIYNAERPPVFWRRYSFWCKDLLDIDKMKEASEFFIGEHDFRSFCANKRMKKSSLRTIYSIDFVQECEKIKINFKGDGFLYQMIRILVGTLIEVGEGKKKPQDMIEILNSLNREKAGFTAPAKGLCLKEVSYD